MTEDGFALIDRKPLLAGTAVAVAVCAGLSSFAIANARNSREAALICVGAIVVTTITFWISIRGDERAQGIALTSTLFGLAIGATIGFGALAVDGNVMLRLLCLKWAILTVLLGYLLRRSFRVPHIDPALARYARRDFIDTLQERYNLPSREATIEYIQTLPDDEKRILDQEAVAWLREFEQALRGPWPPRG